MEPWRQHRFALAATSALILSGCVTTRPVESPIGVPPAWSTSSPVYSGPVSSDGWLKDISSRELPLLVQEAQEHNFDLKAAAARMRAARSRQVIEGADRFPQLQGVQDSSRILRVDQDDLRQRANDFDLALNLSWEIDLWGRLRDFADAAGEEANATESDFRAARLSLAGNTSKAWFNAIETELQVRLANETLTSFQSNLDIIQRAFNAGVDEPGGDNALRPAPGTGQRRRCREPGGPEREEPRRLRPGARDPARPLPFERDRNRQRPAANPAPCPYRAPVRSAARRPDLIAAERRLAAAGLRINAARKAFLPSFRLTARGGTNSSDFSELLDPDRLVANLAGGSPKRSPRAGACVAL